MSATATKIQYSLNTKQKTAYIGIILLDQMNKTGIRYPLIPNTDDAPLEDALTYLFCQDYTKILKTKYAITDKGIEYLRGLKQRQAEYLDVFDLYCAVDLNTGEFAFEKILDYDGELWTKYLNQDRWEDLRVAVAEYKQMNPVEIVFMSFLSGGKFDTENPDWQFNLTLGSAFDEMLAVCNTNLGWQQLGYQDAPAESVIQDIIRQGSGLMFQLLQKQKAINDALPPTAPVTEEVITVETTEEVVVEDFIPADPILYYDPWYNPLYVSPIWVEPLVFF